MTRHKHDHLALSIKADGRLDSCYLVTSSGNIQTLIVAPLLKRLIQEQAKGEGLFRYHLNAAQQTLLDKLNGHMTEQEAASVVAAWMISEDSGKEYQDEIDFCATCIGVASQPDAPYFAKANLKSGQVQCFVVSTSGNTAECILLKNYDFPMKNNAFAINTIRAFSKLVLPSKAITPTK